MSTKQKKISNRYDQYEIQSVFTDSTEEYLTKKEPPLHRLFYIKCIIGPLLGINAYLSHWGPWKWPSNYYFLIFSIIFYYLASYVYSKLDVVDKSDGSMVGEFIVGGTKKKYIFIISDSKLQYILQEIDSNTHQILRKIPFFYPQYFTQSGVFLEKSFQKKLAMFLKNK